MDAEVLTRWVAEVAEKMGERQLAGICYFWAACPDDDEGLRPVLLSPGSSPINALDALAKIAIMFFEDPAAALAQAARIVTGTAGREGQ